MPRMKHKQVYTDLVNTIGDLSYDLKRYDNYIHIIDKLTFNEFKVAKHHGFYEVMRVDVDKFVIGDSIQEYAVTKTIGVYTWNELIYGTKYGRWAGFNRTEL